MEPSLDVMETPENLEREVVMDYISVLWFGQ